MAGEAKFKMSQERLNEIREELYYLETVREKEVSELIKEARSFGDLSENSEYDEAKIEQGKLYSKIAELRNILENAEIIETQEATNVIALGSKVKVECVDEGGVEEYQIVGSQEANPMQGRISDDSPFGRGLMGRAVGEIVTIYAPAGELNFKILSIEN
ncbi:MAG: transcription elongation factor GreA [Clostridiales bacterium]|jgi:transcription elongation factor GreA|nr:transcription elongation factor GreA [Clostridiales bacterium]